MCFREHDSIAFRALTIIIVGWVTGMASGMQKSECRYMLAAVI